VRKEVMFWLAGLLLVSFGLFAPREARADVSLQQPTVAIPTVTGTPVGPTIVVNLDQDQINVRSGPGTLYPNIGVLVAGQEVPARGRTVAGLWIQIVYPGVEGNVGWVYAPLVTVRGGDLPIVEPPPTPTPRTTPTIDPTLAAQFVFDTPVPRPPTFTPPPPLVIPTFEPVAQHTATPGVPIILIIAGLGGLGGLFGVISLFRR